MAQLIEPGRSSLWKSRGLRYTLAGVAGLTVVVWAALAMLAPRAGPYLKDHLIRDLEERFDGTAELGALHVSLFPELHVVGENLVLRREGRSADPPFLTVRRFDLRGSPWGLLRWPLSVGTVRVTGLLITIPPRGQRPKLQGSGAEAQKSAKTLFVVGKVICDDAHLQILTEKPGKLPLTFDIEDVVLSSAGPDRAMPFTAKLTNPKPAGYIQSKGDFGPWETQEPRDTPVSGTYSFSNANLATIKGIGGILSSQGRFSGVLGQIEVQGQSDTPDFTVSTGGHPMPLHTDFNATVDGSTGDTSLHPVRATLAHSVIIANGSVVRLADGHQVTLDVVSSDARIEDLLKVAVKTNPPTLSGPVTLHTKFLLPPGPQAVPERANLDGTFNLPAAHFSNPKAQDRLDQLSVRAEGKPEEAKDAPEILSELGGNFKVKDGVVSLSNLKFQVPGASIALAGDYRLDDEEFSFEGQARLEAKLSQMTTGIKSFFLKAIDPLFSKQGAGTVLPIKISGTGTDPSIRLDFGHLKRAN
jgi:hypothetical protein